MVPCLRGELLELWLDGNDLHVKLSSPFREEIEARKKAIAEWGQHRKDNSETLSDKPPRLHHYLFMSRALPMMAYKDPANFVRLIESPVGGTFLNIVWDTIGKALDAQDYIPSLEWNYAKYSPQVDTDILCLRFSPPVQEQEVWMAAVLVTPGKKRLFLPPLPQYRFFTLEAGLNARDGEQMVLWEWEKGLHRYYSQVPATDERGFAQAVFADARKT